MVAKYLKLHNGDFIFSGDTDGSDNWNEICAVDTDGTKDITKNYPIFDYVLNYASTSSLMETDYKEGWYLPSVAELFEVIKNKEIINDVLQKMTKTQINADNYISSSQSNTSNYILNVYGEVVFGIGSQDKNYEDSDYAIRVMREF